MRIKLVLLICFLPGLLLAKSSLNPCTAVCEGVNGQDSIPQEQVAKSTEVAPPPPTASAQGTPSDKPGPDDWKQNGLFQALFHVGVNFAKLNGDSYIGFDKLGFDGGVGALIRFHKYLSTSIEINYTQWGAKASVLPNGNDYRVKLNYAQVPISINFHDLSKSAHDKDVVMFSAGINLGLLGFYDERNESGVDITDTVRPQPKKFDLDAFASILIIIRKRFGMGFKYSYSMIPIRGVEAVYQPYTRFLNEYNSVVTFRFTYIFSSWKKKH